MIKIDPTNNAKALKVTRLKTGRVLIVADFGQGIVTKASISASTAQKYLSLASGQRLDPAGNLQRMGKDTFGGTRLFFKSNNDHDLVVVNTFELEEALKQ